MMNNFNDKRIESLVNRTLEKYFNKDAENLDVAKYSKCLIQETVIESMKQMALPLDIKDPAQSAILQKQWDHLVVRFGIAEKDME